MKLSHTAILAAALLFVAGCTTGVAGSAKPSTTTTITPKPSTGPSSSAVATAADGNNVADCAGGNCEVEVGTGLPIELMPQYGVGPVLAFAFDGDAVDLGVASDSPQLDFACSGGTPSCQTQPQQPQQIGTLGSALAHAGAVITADELTVNVVAVKAKTVILRLSIPG